MGKLFILASSSTEKNKNGAKQVEKLSIDANTQLSEVEKTPLKGINVDIQKIKSGCDPNNNQLQVVKSSRYENCLLKRVQIIQQIEEFFSDKNETFKYFIYTGHGQYNGDLWIQTQENPDGQRLSIEEIVHLWRRNRRQDEEDSLWLYFDSCYSGNNAFRYHEIRQKDDKIFMYCSSGPNHTSVDIYRYGGLLIHHLFNTKFVPKSEKTQLERKFYERQPVCFDWEKGVYAYKDKRVLKPLVREN